MSAQEPSDAERKAKSAEDKRAVTIRVINNAFIMRTRSGTYAYVDFPSLCRALQDYLELIQKEIARHEKENR